MNAMSSMHPTMMTMDHAFGYQQRTYQTAVLRRGQPFFIAVRMKDRNFDPRRDILRVCFNFGIYTSKLFFTLPFFAQVLKRKS
jgi:hypothetical protein